MSARRIVGLILVVIGIVALLTGGIRWTRGREKTVLDAGSIEIKAEEHQRIPLPPILGAVALIGGVVLLVASERRRA
jgi:drug/metabolite transporter (DMT)-like permease